MDVQSVTLTSEAAHGLTIDRSHMQAVASLPIEVKLGRLPPKDDRKPVALHQLMKFVKDVPVPDAVDWYTKAAPSVAKMYLNDRYGDCVFAGKAHDLGIWSFNDPDSGGGVLATDKEISDQYFAYTGGRDAGAVITEVLDYMKSPGFLAGGKRYTIADYVSCDWTSKELTQVGLALFGTGSIGIDLPNAWTSNAIWDVTNTGIVGGHDVSPAGYGNKVLGTNADGVVILSWGRLYLITWAAWTSRKWLTEFYLPLPTFLWTGTDKMAPSGVDYAGLLNAVKIISGGGVPPLPGPTPPPVPPVPVPPPAPPTHPAVTIPPTVTSFHNWFLGTVQIPIPGGMYPVTNVAGYGSNILSGPSEAVWQDVLKLFGQLAMDVGTSNWGAVYGDLMAILQALHVFGVSLRLTSNRMAELKVSWLVLGKDLFALGLAIYSRNVPAVIAALTKIAADLGLEIL